jgi:hypothetical protein
MAQYDLAVRHAKLRAIATAIGPNPVLEIRTGQQPAACAAPSTGAMLVRIELGDDWMGAPADGRMRKSGPWEGTAAATGDAGHFRIYSADGACRVQGSIGTAGTDMIVDGVFCIAGQVFAVNSFSIADNNG